MHALGCIASRLKNYSEDVQPSGNEALVKMKCDLNMKGFDLKDNSETQNWINEDGQWYLKMKTDKGGISPR
jgi:hypothetical protein